MSDARREAILQKVRQGVGASERTRRRQEIEHSLQSRQVGPQPALSGNRLQRFVVRAEAQASTVAFVSHREQVPAHVAAWLRDQSLSNAVVMTSDLVDLDWAEAGIRAQARVAVDADSVGISSVFRGVVETGTLLLHSGPQTPGSVSLLPETHVALLHVADLADTMETALSDLVHALGGMPRAVNFISGPSRTGDIEQTIVLGAHGPCRVHIVLIGEVEASSRPTYTERP